MAGPMISESDNPVSGEVPPLTKLEPNSEPAGSGAREAAVADLAECRGLMQWLEARGLKLNSCEPVKSVGGRRTVVRLPGPDSGVSFFIKRRAADALSSVRGPDPPRDALSFYPEVLLRCVDCNLTVERNADGTPLDRVPESDRLAAYGQAGRDLADFHNQTFVSQPSGAASRIVRKIDAILSEARSLDAERDAIPAIEDLNAIAASMNDGQLNKSWVHGDMKPEHVYWSPSGCCFVDADRRRIGYAILDAGNMLNHIEWREGSEAREAHAFIAGYGEVAPIENGGHLWLARLHGAARTLRNRTAHGTERDSAQPLRTLVRLWSDGP